MIFRAPALLDEQALKEIRRPRDAAMCDRQAQMRDARLEILIKAGERARRGHRVVGADAARQLAGDRSRRRLVAGGDARLELRPQIGRDLDGEVAHAMGQTALAPRARKAFLDRPNDPRRAVGHDKQRIAQASCAQVLEAASGCSLGPPAPTGSPFSLPRFRQGASQPLFPASLRHHRAATTRNIICLVDKFED
jgi:hypothetical protein